jgi:hypothetical protein
VRVIRTLARSTMPVSPHPGSSALAGSGSGLAELTWTLKSFSL